MVDLIKKALKATLKNKTKNKTERNEREYQLMIAIKLLDADIKALRFIHFIGKRSLASGKKKQKPFRLKSRTGRVKTTGRSSPASSAHRHAVTIRETANVRSREMRETRREKPPPSWLDTTQYRWLAGAGWLAAQ